MLEELVKPLLRWFIRPIVQCIGFSAMRWPILVIGGLTVGCAVSAMLLSAEFPEVSWWVFPAWGGFAGATIGVGCWNAARQGDVDSDADEVNDDLFR